jgi:hypothetical protein
MPTMSDLRTYLAVIQIGTHVLLLTKLFRAKLLPKYQYFGLFVGFELLRLAIVSFVQLKSSLYAHFYFATQPILWTLFVLMMLELFQLVLRNHPGIASLGRKALTYSLIATAVASAMTLLIDLQQPHHESALLFNFMLLERLVMTSLLGLVLCLTVFLSYFPVPLTRNARIHACVLAAYFGVKTSTLWIRTIYGLQPTPMLNIVGQLLAIGCLIAWTILLVPADEDIGSRRGPKEESEARLLAQLDALNETLLGSTRK